MPHSQHMGKFLASNLVNISVAIAGLAVVLLGIVLGHQAWHASELMTRARQAHDAMNEILAATDAQARERGLTAARLSARGVNTPLLPELGNIRAEVDAAWKAGREQSAPILRVAEPVDRQFRELEDALAAMRAVRGHVDAGLSGKGDLPSLNKWMQVTSAVNAEAAALRQELLLAVQGPREATRFWLLINTHAAELAEQVGQFRGILAYYVAAKQPLPPPQAEEARFFYRVAQQHLTRLLAVANELAPESSEITERLERIRIYRARLRDTSAEMLAEADTGAYPLNIGEWWTRASEFIDRVFALTEAVESEIEHHFWQEARANALWLGGYGVLAIVAAVLAVASLNQVRRYISEVFIEKEVSETILESIGDAVIATESDGRIKYLNPIASELTGWRQVESHGRPYEEVFRIYNRLHSSEADPIGTCLTQDRIVVLNEGHVLVARDGREIPIDDTCAPIRDHEGRITGSLLVFTSKERSQTSEGILSYHASHDSLTGLYNRRAFEHHLIAALKSTRAHGGEHALAFIDLDNFKVINDTAGHEAGDQMLRRIGFLMKRQVRDSDVLGRLGGDEFALLLKNCNLRQAEYVAHKLREEVRELRFPWDGHSFQSGLSIGLVAIDTEVPNVEAALRDADSACYAAKELGRNHIHVHRQNDKRLAERQGYTAWAAHITEALDEERFILYCQEIQPLRQGLATHSEVLLRLFEPDGTMVSPGAFIPAAERHGLMPDIDQWVIEKACQMTAPGLASNSGHVVTINLSGTTLSDVESAERIAEAVERHEVPPAQICFEITETAAVSSLDTALVIMERLRGEGFRFALDDFGSGLSSLNYLKELPVDLVKIDGRFIRHLPNDPVATAMVGAIVDIAEVMHIKTCAEFVENAFILAALEKLGVDYGQGYYFAKPRPLSECLERRVQETPGQLALDYL